MTLAATALVDLTQAKNFIRKDAAASLQVFAEFVGVGDNSDVTFSLDHTPISGSLKLYVNDTLQTETTHFSITAANITFVTAPPLNQGITASYDYAASANTFESYDDDILDVLINAATKKCEDSCGRAFIQRSITENRIGDGGKRLVLNKRPVNTFTSMTLAGTALVEDTDFTLYKEDGVLIRPVAVSLWTDNPGGVVWTDTAKIVMVYNAGYASTRAATQALVPDAVLAVLMTVAAWSENRLGLRSQSITGIGSEDFGIPGELPEQAKKLLGGLQTNLGIF
jgi:hypothetical protein